VAKISLRKLTWLAVLVVPCAHAKINWKAVDAEALSQKAPLVDKDAPAEILFREILLDFSDTSITISEYARIKIFNERGLEQANVSVPYVDKDKIREASGRTIKPNGSIQEAGADSIFKRTVIKAGGRKLNVATLALPGVEPGDIIEYYWKVKNPLGAYERIDVQAEIPSQRVRLATRNVPLWLNAQWVRVNLAGSYKSDLGETSFEFTNLPAIHREPLMPPDDAVRGWMLIICRRNLAPSDDLQLMESLKIQLKGGGNIRRAAQEIVGNATSEDDKLRKIYEYCHDRIKRVGEDADSLEALAYKENHDLEDTLKRGTGTGADIDRLFIALARAAGFDACWARLPDGGQLIHDEVTMTDPYFFRAFDVGIRLATGRWRFFEPAGRQLPFGLLRWQEEGQVAVVINDVSRRVSWVTTPVAPANESACNRVGLLRLGTDGTLEGDIHIGYTGHLAVEKRQELADRGEEEWKKVFSDGIRNRWKGAEAGDVRIAQRDLLGKPLLVQFHLRLPGYASRSGKRVFLQPSIFDAGATPWFTDAKREYPVYFHFSWSEQDEYSIELPPGQVLENAEMPELVSAGDIPVHYQTRASVAGGSRLLYRRAFSFGRGGSTLIPVAQYTSLKSAMDRVQENDNQTLVLKQAAAEAAR
jgi:hypothetical protein